jgi:hypothetical protein
MGTIRSAERREERKAERREERREERKEGILDGTSEVGVKKIKSHLLVDSKTCKNAS